MYFNKQTNCRMKRLAITLNLCLLTFIVSAQSETKKYVDTEAEAVLTAVQKRLASYSTVKMGFLLQTQKNDKIVSEYKGTLLVKQQKYILDMENLKVFCNGETLWTYLVDAKEVNVTDYDSSDEEQLNPLHLMNTYKQHYTIKMIREEQQRGVMLQIIDLTPKHSSAIAKVRLIINKEKKQIYRMIVSEKDGTNHTYFVESFLVNQRVDDSKFDFNAALYPNVELIDLR